MSKLIVTITPPTPNGNLHLGHISGPFLAADIFARIHRLKGDEVVFLCYSDDYQSYVARKAREKGKKRFELATHFANEIEKTLQASAISVDWFLKAYNNSYFREAVSLFYDHSHRKSAIIQKNELVPYSNQDEVYGYEAFGRGICNYCGHVSDPSQCENCAQAPDLHKMGNITSVISQTPMDWISRSREFLDLDIYREQLKEYYRTIPLRSYLRDYFEFTLSRENLLWPIDRPGEYGIDIAVNGRRNKIHTWFSGIAGYMAAFKEYAANSNHPGLFDQFWHNSQTKLVHFLGYDCAFSHGIVYPSLLRNVDGLTKNVYLFPNKFLKLEGQDFSTSRGIAIWMTDILKEASLDSVRFYLAMHSPEEETTNFEMDKFKTWTQNIFMPATKIIQSACEGAAGIFQQKEALSEPDAQKACQVIEQWNKYASIEFFSIRKMAALLSGLLEYICQKSQDDTTGLQQLGQLYLLLALPLHPHFSEKILKRTGENIDNAFKRMQNNFITAQV